MAVTEAQAHAVLPIYREHQRQVRALASEAAESLATLQHIQQARVRWGWFVLRGPGCACSLGMPLHCCDASA